MQRFSALRRERNGVVVTIVAPDGHESWDDACPLVAGWRGIASPPGTGMFIEEDGDPVRVVLEEQTTYTVRVAGATCERAGFGEPHVQAVSAARAHEAVFRLETGNLIRFTTIVFDPTSPEDESAGRVLGPVLKITKARPTLVAIVDDEELATFGAHHTDPNGRSVTTVINSTDHFG